MPQPRVFVSSVYVGLKDVRSTVANALTSQGYIPVLFERGGIAFEHANPLDESCYEAVKDCDFFVLIVGGRYGSPASKEGRVRGKKYISITRQEHTTAVDAGVPTYVFIDANVHAEYATWKKIPRGIRKSLKQYAHVDNPQVFELIHSIYALRKNNLIQTYVTADDIVRSLKDQLTALIHRYATDQRSRLKADALVRINPYKLFYHRHDQKLSFNDLAERSGVDKKTLRRLESLSASSERLTASTFPEVERRVVTRLEDVLKTPGPLVAGRPDDFLSAYIQYYAYYKSKSFVPTPAKTEEVFPTKAVVFDFDGTLTRRVDDETSWEKIWKRLGYGIQECAHYHSLYSAQKITHRQWCDITRRKFAERGLHRTHVEEVAASMTLVSQTGKVLHALRSRGLKLYLLSGSIRQVIEIVLGDLADLFEDIRANEFVFDRNGVFEKIIGTKYDFEGKGEYLAALMKSEDYDPLEVLFIGNSCNDVFASRSGARTLCVNPRFTDPQNVEHWTYFIRKMADLSEVLPFIFLDSTTENVSLIQGHVTEAQRTHGSSGAIPRSRGGLKRRSASFAPERP